MSLAKLGFLAIFAALVALAPQAANNPGLTNQVKAPDANHQIPSMALLPVQFKNPDSLGLGKLLVASRNLGDPNFAGTVVLLVHYDADGVVGLVLNRRTKLPLSRALEGIKAAKDVSDPIYIGGPVDPSATLALLKSSAKLGGAKPVFNGVSLVASKALFEQTLSARTGPNAFRVYLGYAGWTAEQLRKEMELGAWFVFPADAATVFNSDPESLWPRMIHKTEQQFAQSTPTYTGAD
jgi:putative AlgH/UPF0301 family transcriptional regulator